MTPAKLVAWLALATAAFFVGVGIGRALAFTKDALSGATYRDAMRVVYCPDGRVAEEYPRR